jgi:hypothetical protein
MKYQLLVITMAAIMRRRLADYFLMPTGAIPSQWGCQLNAVDNYAV